ncbi:MAG: glycosyltransferase family 2 protein [Planctomycetes bacterium]|nr:glycosyltransferase family 2 protein [Planctomycetota bacterium]
MSNLIKDKATICIVNYKTLDFTRLCLRSIRKFTKYPYEVIVVDNDSQDESLKYLKSLNWIRLIERRSGENEPGGGYAHGAGLDLGLENCNTEYFISMHSDTFVRKDNWLKDLIYYFGHDESIVCVGSGKIEMIPAWRIMLKKATDFRTFKRKILREPDPVGKFRYWNRTICSLYRTDILCRERLSFLMGRDKGLTGGKKLYFELVDLGHKTVELPPSVMGRFIYHLAHATQVVNQSEFNLRSRTKRKINRNIKKIMNSQQVQGIMTDSSLDN